MDDFEFQQLMMIKSYLMSTQIAIKDIINTIEKMETHEKNEASKVGNQEIRNQ